MTLQVQSLASPVGQGSGVAVNCGVGGRHGLDPTLLWLWCRPTARAQIRPLAWELLCATGEAVQSKKRQDPVSSHHLQTTLVTAMIKISQGAVQLPPQLYKNSVCRQVLSHYLGLGTLLRTAS